MCGGKRTDSRSASDTGTATIKMIAAAPVSSAPNNQRGSSMKLAPRNAAACPVAVATEFIVTTWSRGTTSGSAADRPDETKRVKPLTINAPNRIARSCAPTASSRGDAEHQQQPTQVGADQHQAPVPAVQQRAGERPQQRIRQEQHRERTGDLPRARGTFGVEQKPTRQTCLEKAVTELAHRPQFEQSPEFR